MHNKTQCQVSVGTHVAVLPSWSKSHSPHVEWLYLPWPSPVYYHSLWNCRTASTGAIPPLQGFIACVLSHFSRVCLFATLWTVACQAPLSMVSRQKYWSGLPCPSPGNLPNPGIKPTSLLSPALASRFFTTSTTWDSPSLSPRVCSNLCPLSQWCYLTISSSATGFSFAYKSFPSVRVFSNESALHIRWTKYWSFNFSISPSNEYSGLTSFRIHWLDLPVVQGTLKNHH